MRNEKTEIRREELKNEGIATLRQFAFQNRKRGKYSMMSLEGKKEDECRFGHHFDFIDRLSQQKVVDDLVECDYITFNIGGSQLEMEVV